MRRSSSMMPSLIVRWGSPEHPLEPGEHVDGQGDLLGTVHLGLDDVDGSVRSCESRTGHARSGMAAAHRDHRVEHALGDLGPSASSTASVNIACPMWRTNRSDRARRSRRSSVGGGAVGLERLRRKVRPPSDGSASRVPCMSFSQVSYAATLSAASTAATESSRSMIVGRRTRDRMSLHARGVGDADRVVTVDRDLEMQAVVGQDDGVGRAGSPRYPANCAGGAAWWGRRGVSRAAVVSTTGRRSHRRGRPAEGARVVEEAWPSRPPLRRARVVLATRHERSRRGIASVPYSAS